MDAEEFSPRLNGIKRGEHMLRWGYTGLGLAALVRYGSRRLIVAIKRLHEVTC